MAKKTQQKPDVYRYCGDGLGVPGLPHDLTREQATALGVLDQLEAALAAGVYIRVEA